MSLIAMRGVAKRYEVGGQEVQALRGVDLDVDANEYIAIVGASGSGKSTLMNILGCLDRPSSGQYQLNGREIAGLADATVSAIRNREIGFVFQNFNLLPRATALDNVIQPLRYRKMSRVVRANRALAALERVGLGDRIQHLPNELSGGQRQRVAIARALVTEPAILLADEPTGNLDTTTTAEILRLFDSVQAGGQTIIIVTHDDAVARRCKRRIAVSDGAIVEDTAA
jgi:putative ABC transport system ATP-binding protein